MLRVERENPVYDFACTMSQKEAGVRALVAKQPEFVGKITFAEDELATNELGIFGRVVGVTSMSNFQDIALFELFSSRVVEVMGDELLMSRDEVLAKESETTRLLDLVEKERERKIQERVEKNALIERERENRAKEKALQQARIREERWLVWEKEAVAIKDLVEKERERKMKERADKKARTQEEKRENVILRRMERRARIEKEQAELQALIDEKKNKKARKQAEQQASDRRRKKRSLSEYFAEIIVIDRTI